MDIVFDVNGTLTDPSGLGEAFGRPGLGAAMLQTAVHTATLDALAGTFRPFGEHLRTGVEWHARAHDLDLAAVDLAVERGGRLDAWPDAEEALDLLRRSGHRLTAFTNSGADAGRRTIDRAGLKDCFERILGVDAVRRSKPHPDAYAYLLRELGVPAAEVVLVAAHDWDVDGAARAGLRTAWVDRDGQALNAAFRRPTYEASTLLGVAEAIAAQG